MTALSIHNLSKVYKNGVPALKEISLTVERGDFFALLGKNGAGKSTLIGILTSLIRKSSGQVIIQGIDIDKDFEGAKACIGVVPQEINLSVFETVLTILLNQAGYYGIPRRVAKQQAERYLHAFDLWNKRHEIVRYLSGGMKRRLMVIRALMHQPNILILDEPTAGVDIEIRRSMWAFLKKINQEGVTVILTTHYLEEAEHLCRHIAIIDEGEIVESTSVSNLLERLEMESFILYLAKPVSTLPEVSGCQLSIIDPHTIEARLPKSYDMSQLFTILQDWGITISRLRNKAGRLEELFVQMIEQAEPSSPLNEEVE